MTTQSLPDPADHEEENAGPFPSYKRKLKRIYFSLRARSLIAIRYLGDLWSADAPDSTLSSPGVPVKAVYSRVSVHIQGRNNRDINNGHKVTIMRKKCVILHLFYSRFILIWLDSYFTKLSTIKGNRWSSAVQLSLALFKRMN